jgi:hypothetical protein
MSKQAINFKDLTGQKFERLLVIKRADNTINKKGKPVVRWLCKCDCGKEIITYSTSLRKSSIRSCGCLLREITIQRSFKDLTNQKFGKLLVVKIDEKRKSKT